MSLETKNISVKEYRNINWTPVAETDNEESNKELFIVTKSELDSLQLLSRNQGNMKIPALDFSRSHFDIGVYFLESYQGCIEEESDFENELYGFNLL